MNRSMKDVGRVFWVITALVVWTLSGASDVTAQKSEDALGQQKIVQDDGISYAPLDNDVTFVGSVDTGIQCFGTAFGGRVGEPSNDLRSSIVQDDDLTYLASDNSVTFTSEGLGPKCSWARGLGGELVLHNAVTIPGGNTLANTMNIP